MDEPAALSLDDTDGILTIPCRPRRSRSIDSSASRSELVKTIRAKGVLTREINKQRRQQSE